MRTGSGAVLLVGFALVVMMLSIAGVISQPTMLIKQDPTQDFADIAGSIREITYACGEFRGSDDEKYEYFNKTITSLDKQLKEKGIILEAYPWVAGAVCRVPYILRTSDNSTYVLGYASTDLNDVWSDYLRGGTVKSLSPLIIVPPALCFNSKNGQGASSTHFLIGNPNPIKIHIIMKYEGDDELKELHVSFPGPGQKGTINAVSGVLEFYLDPMTEPRGKGVALGQRTMGDAFINIKHNSQSNSSKITITVPEYNFEQDIPIYWDTCPVISWGQLLKTLRTGG